VRREGWFGPKNQKPSRGGSVLASEVLAGFFRAGYAGTEVQGGYDRVRREGGVVWAKKTKNRAVEARFWLAKCGRARFWVEGTLLGWGTLGLRCREGAIG